MKVVTMVDLLQDFDFAPSLSAGVVNSNDHFSQQFWGEKNQGFAVLYHNMKQGQVSVKMLQDFLRESANTEDVYAKHLTKLAKQASNSSNLGTFSPMFEILRGMSEKLSSCHMDIVHKLHDIIKDLAKYLDEQKGKHKQMKESLSPTVEALQLTQTTTVAVNKAKEKYHQLCVEAERLKRAGSIPKDIEKVEVKAKKAAEEYRTFVDKYTTVRSDFEAKMTESSKKFQQVEEAHLKHMKSILDTYILSFDNASVLINQVHEEFQRKVDENTAESLIKQYSDNKGTGSNKPAPIVFEECDPSLLLVTISSDTSGGSGALSNGVDEGATTPTAPAAPPTSKSTRKPLGLPFRRKKRAQSKKDSSASLSSGGKDQADKDGGESIDSPEKDALSVKIDEEGFTIRPETPKERKSWTYESGSGSNSDSSDSEDFGHHKIQVKIKPKSETPVENSESTMEALSAITQKLTLSAPNPLGSRRAPLSGGARTVQNIKDDRSKSPSVKSDLSDELLDFLATSNSSTAPSSKTTPDHSAPPPCTTPTSATLDTLADLFTTSASSQSPSLDSFAMPEMSTSSSTGSNTFTSFTNNNTTRPTVLAFNPAKKPSSPAPLASCESWSSMSSMGERASTPSAACDNFASISRGPSPVSLQHGDPVPIAVAFTETVNAFFKAAPEHRCMVKIQGEVQMSFPAGIIRSLTTNPNPPDLTFRVNAHVKDFNPNPNLLSVTSKSGDGEEFSFNMPSLIQHIKKLMEANPSSPFYNVAILNYLLSSPSGAQLVPLHLASKWKCEEHATELTVDYKYNTEANCSGTTLKNVNILVPISGAVTNVSSSPIAHWNPQQGRLIWKLTTPITPTTAPGQLTTRLQLEHGPGVATTLAVQFVADGATLTGADFQLTCPGYRLSLVKRRFVSGRYMAEAAS